MKRFTVPCDFGGKKAPFHIYIGEPHPKNHPLQNQSNWLSSERGGTIPQEVMDSFEKLHKISIEHNVSFEELCVYALGSSKDGKMDTSKMGKIPGVGGAAGGAKPLRKPATAGAKPAAGTKPAAAAAGTRPPASTIKKPAAKPAAATAKPVAGAKAATQPATTATTQNAQANQQAKDADKPDDAS